MHSRSVVHPPCVLCACAARAVQAPSVSVPARAPPPPVGRTHHPQQPRRALPPSAGCCRPPPLPRTGAGTPIGAGTRILLFVAPARRRHHPEKFGSLHAVFSPLDFRVRISPIGQLIRVPPALFTVYPRGTRVRTFPYGYGGYVVISIVMGSTWPVIPH